MKNPWPLFNPLTQTPADWIHFDVLCFGGFLMMITQAMIEEVELPLDFVEPREIPFPVTDRAPHTPLTRERNDTMQMVRHEQQESTMPLEMAVVIGGSRKDGFTNSAAAE